VKALVTGSSGFVGRHLCDEFERRGWDVVGIDLRIGNHNVFQEVNRRGQDPFCAVKGEPRSTFLHGDVREIFKKRGERTFEFAGILNELEETRFDLVAHCAYHVGGRTAIDGNPSLLALNLELDARLFEWAVRTRQRAVMYFSSSAAYPIRYQELSAARYHGGGPWIALSECLIDLKDIQQPDARYGWAKLTGEQLAAAAAEQELRVHVLRPFSGYGGDQDKAYPFPAILERVLAGDLSVWGSPGQTRDWIHIDDVVAGALAVYRDDFREPVNLCTGVGTEFGVLATMMARQFGIDVGAVDPSGCSERVTYLPDQPTGVMVRVGDPTRMSEIYEPVVTLEESIGQALAEVRR
jgi:nucleoside-diphosphate-sugar epimerase